MENHLKRQHVAHSMANDTVQPADRQYQATYQVIGGESHGMGHKTHAEYEERKRFSAPTDRDAAVAACMLATTLANDALSSPGTGKTTVTLVSLLGPAKSAINVAALLKESAARRYALTKDAKQRPFEQAWQATFPDGNYRYECSTEEKVLRHALGF